MKVNIKWAFSWLLLALFVLQLIFGTVETKAGAWKLYRGGESEPRPYSFIEDFSREDSLENLQSDHFIRLAGGWEPIVADGYDLEMSRFNDAVIEGQFEATRLEIFARLNGQRFELALDSAAPVEIAAPDTQSYAYFKLADGLKTGSHHFRLRLVTRGDGPVLAHSLRINGDWVSENYPAQVKLLGYGSSTIEGTGVLWELCQAKHWEAINRGIGGSTVFREGQSRVGRDVLSQQPDVILLNYGSNDWYENIPISQFRAAYHHMLTELAHGLPQARLVVVGIFPREGGNEATRGAYNQVIQDSLEATGLLARAHYLEIAGYSWPTDSYDGTHPNRNAVLTKFVPQILPWLNGLTPQ